MYGIDAPESAQTCIADGVTWSCGKSATAALTEFIRGLPVRCLEQGSDRYRRTIAACTVQSEDIEAWMVLNGWALAYRRYSLEHVAQEQAAQAARMGIWRGEFMLPWNGDAVCGWSNDLKSQRRDRPYPAIIKAMTPTNHMPLMVIALANVE